MQLLICQSCGVVLRNKGKHCTSCGVPLALNSPTQMPVFKQTRPPLEVSVQQDHLLIEKVVNHRQISVLSGPKKKFSSYSSSSASGSYTVPSSVSAPAINRSGGPDSSGNGGNGHGNGNGNGNGNRGGNGNGNGNGNGGGVANSSPSSTGTDSPKQVLPSAEPKSSASPAAKSKEESPSLNEFGSFSIEESPKTSEPQSSSLMSAFSKKGLVKDPTKESSADSKSNPDTIGTAEDWGGSTSESLDKVESKDSESNDVKPEEKANQSESNSQPEPKTSFLAKGIAGSAVSIAIGSAVSGGLAQATKRPEKQEVDSVKEADKPESSSDSPVAETPASEPENNVVQSTNPNIQTGISVSTSGASKKSGAFNMPTEVKNSGEVVISEEKSSPKPEIAQDSEPPILSADQIALNIQQSEQSSKESTKDTPVQPIAADTDNSASEKPAAPVSSNTASNNFDFSEQFGTDFNPEDFFGGVPGDPEVGAEFENLPINDSSQEQPKQNQAVANSEETKVEETSAPVEEKEEEQQDARQEVMDFFGDSQDASVSAVSQNSAAVAASSSQDAGGFDFFEDSSSPKTQLERPYVQEATPNTASVTTLDNDGPKTEIISNEESEQKPIVAMPKGIKSKTTETELKSDETDDSAKEAEADDDSEDDTNAKEEEVKSSAPKRRSFSGGSITPQKTKAKSKSDDDDDDDDLDDDEEGDSKLNWLEQEVSLGSLNVSRQTAIVLAAVGAFILIQIPGWIMAFAGALTGGPQVAQRPQQGQMARRPSAFGGGAAGGNKPKSILAQARKRHEQRLAPAAPAGGMQPGQMQGGQQANSGAPLQVGGKWVVNVFTNKNTYKSEILMNQTGNTFSGKGVDGFGDFFVQGNFIPPNKLAFNKTYTPEAKRRGALTMPIAFSGVMGREQNNIVAKGMYESQMKVGYEQSINNPARMVPIGGKWQGALVAPAALEQTKPDMFSGIKNMFGGNQLPGIGPKPQQQQGKQGHPKPRDLHGMFLNIALGLVGIGICIFAFFLFLFGPSGWMNIWEKKKYIPSQFKSQHLKMVRELGKPLKPGATPLGKRLEWNIFFFWRPKYLALPPDQREKNPHMLLLGGSDKGKTRLMASMITHDIKSNDRAIVLIDSDGQLSDLIVEWIAADPDGQKYAKRVVLVDPTYEAGSLAYNPLEMPEDGDLQSAASAIVHGFKAIYTEPPGQQGGGQNQWNQQTANILRNASLLLMANGRTLTDLPNLLQDNDFRDIMLETVERRKAEKTEYINIIDTWNQYKKLARTDQWINWVEPILNRVGPMLGDGRIRPILTKPVSDLKLKEVILEKKILIVKVPQGELDQNANLLGSLMVTGLQQAAMALQKEKPYEVRPCALFLDDLDSFIEKETVEQLCAETKRYQIGFVGSIKTLQHLPEDFKSQLIINVGTMCVFALAKKDGDMLGPQMFRVDGRKIKHQTITNFFNKVNTSPQFELIMDEEKLNIDRIVGQEEQTFFCYRVGTVAGVFKLKAYDFKDIPRKKLDTKLIEKMHAVTDNFSDSSKS